MQSLITKFMVISKYTVNNIRLTINGKQTERVDNTKKYLGTNIIQKLIKTRR